MVEHGSRDIAERRKTKLVEHLLSGRRLRIEVAPRARHHDEASQPGYAPRLTPAQEIEEGIGADEQMERALVFERDEGVDGVGGAFAAQLDVGNGETRVRSEERRVGKEREPPWAR